jgi:misacylated tRNA(Ala) deacylase
MQEYQAALRLQKLPTEMDVFSLEMEQIHRNRIRIRSASIQHLFMLSPTKRLYWDDDHRLETEAVVVAVRDNSVALDQTCCYAGGGGQPPDHGTLEVQTATLTVMGVKSDADGVLWHECSSNGEAGWVGSKAKLAVDRIRRTALSRYHTVLHLVNTIALRDYGAWITGAQIDVEYARIDFKWDGLSPSVCADVEAKVNAEIAAGRRIRAYSLTEAEFSARPELLRTLEVRPPVIGGRVRVVEIQGFDAQACGGTHVDATGELGRFSVQRTENKGRINKRLYVRLDQPDYFASTRQKSSPLNFT